MAFIADQVRGGLQPYQHHPRGGESEWPLDTRTARAAGRIIDYDNLGRAIIEDGSHGDVIGAVLWKEREGERPMPAWNPGAFPAVVAGGAPPERLVPVPTGQEAISSAASGSEAIAPALLSPPSPPPQERGGGAITGPGLGLVLPVRDASWTPDSRFGGKMVETVAPPGTRGIVLAGTEEYRQEDVFYSSLDQSPLIAAHRGPQRSRIPGSTPVHDLRDDGSIDRDEFLAPLNSMFWIHKDINGNDILSWYIDEFGQPTGHGGGGYVIAEPQGGPFGVPTGRNTPFPTGGNETRFSSSLNAWINQSRNGSAGQIGQVIAIGSALEDPTKINDPAPVMVPEPTLILADVEGRDNFAPFDVGTLGDRHQIGVTPEGIPINPLHFSERSLFHWPQVGDGPLDFSPLPPPAEVNMPFWVPVTLRFDERFQRWRWWSKSGMYPYPECSFPPYLPPDYPVYPPPDDPNRQEQDDASRNDPDDDRGPDDDHDGKKPRDDDNGRIVLGLPGATAKFSKWRWPTPPGGKVNRSTHPLAWVEAVNETNRRAKKAGVPTIGRDQLSEALRNMATGPEERVPVGVPTGLDALIVQGVTGVTLGHAFDLRAAEDEIRSRQIRNLAPKQHPYHDPAMAMHTPLAAPGLLARPAETRFGMGEGPGSALQLQPNPDTLELSDHDQRTPVTAQLVAIGAELGDGTYRYTQNPCGGNTGVPTGDHWAAGTSPGGWALMPAELTLQDLQLGLDLPVRVTSPAILAATVGTAFGFGSIDRARGSVIGHAILPLADGTTQIQRFRSNGTHRAMETFSDIDITFNIPVIHDEGRAVQERTVAVNTVLQGIAGGGVIDEVILGDATAGTISVTLPAISDVDDGQLIRVKKIEPAPNANRVDITPAGADTIDHLPGALQLAARDSFATVIADTAASIWRVVA